MTTESIVNGWRILKHSQFENQVNRLISKVEDQKKKDPLGYEKKNNFKILNRITHFAYDEIPKDPGNSKFRLGDELGQNYKNWFRAKFLQQYRLFFRYKTTDKTIILAWVNDEKTKRSYDSKTDAYVIFKKKLDNGEIPSNFEELLKSVTTDQV